MQDMQASLCLKLLPGGRHGQFKGLKLNNRAVPRAASAMLKIRETVVTRNILPVVCIALLIIVMTINWNAILIFSIITTITTITTSAAAAAAVAVVVITVILVVFAGLATNIVISSSIGIVMIVLGVVTAHGVLILITLAIVILTHPHHLFNEFR